MKSCFKDEDKTQSDLLHANEDTANQLCWKCPFCEEKIEISGIQNQDDFKKVTSHCFKHAKEEEISCPICSIKYKVRQFQAKFSFYLTLFYMSFSRYLITWGGGGLIHPL